MSLALFDSKVFDSFLKTKWLGRSIIWKDVTETTMDDARVASQKGSPFGTIILAETQTNARGTKTHKWNALNRGNIYVSLIINRKVQQEEFVDIFDVEVTAALSVLAVLKDLGLQDVKMKWPNDLWVNGHKLGGFLAENCGQIPGSSENIYILGIGLNVNADIRRNPDVHAIASSFRSELDGKIVNREKLLADICNNLESALQWDRDLLYAKAMENQLYNTGDKVKVSHFIGGKISIGVIEKIDENWSLVFKDEAGQTFTGTSQQYSIRPYTTQNIYVYNGVLTSPWCATLLIKTFSALIDTCVYSVSSLNDPKLKEGSWKQNAAMLVIGDIVPKEDPNYQMRNFLTEIQNFLDNGGKVFASGSAAHLLHSDVLNSSVLESDITLEELVIGENKGKEMTSIKVTLKDSEKEFIGVTVNKNMALSSEILQKCDIIAKYSSGDKLSSAGAIVMKQGKGLVALIGLNIEITYADIGEITSGLLINKVSEIDELEKTVFERDVLVRNIINRLLIP